ncbi:YihY/virulence factor BrkB family protein [Neobacillus notoginsengisoli]|uniref:YihY/virulence factor BrkB family protein n=1 Tax=Neobacillus notoginsengisoli TaxID=1578198 RepID=A0A417YWF4_9BACI|nr:YihY/virulence factor BrkB family protein [Neobacillus notoginsengisoli]RHW41749.1 YihY/virulence factor BrkB family protein [Neobacillus notoginsengisoli]
MEEKVENVSRLFSKNIVKQLIHRIQEDDLPGLAAQLAYYFLLSLFPLLIFLFTLLPYLPVPQDNILGAIGQYAPEEAMALIEKNLDSVMAKRNGGLLSIGIIGTIWSASNGINALVRAFNKAYNVKESRSLIVARGTAILLTFGMITVFIVALALPVFGKAIGLFLFTQLGLGEEFHAIWAAIRWAVSALILFGIFTVLYWVAPNVKMKCKSAVPGAIFATLGWTVVSLLFSFYVNNFGNYSATYGSIGAFIILMIWLFLSGLIIILGGEVNAFYAEKAKENC